MKQSPVRILRDHSVELRLRLSVIDHVINARNGAVAHDEPPRDHHVRHVTTRPVEQDGLNWIDALTDVGAVQPDDIQVRRTARGKPSQIRAVQRGRAAQSGSIVEIGGAASLFKCVVSMLTRKSTP